MLAERVCATYHFIHVYIKLRAHTARGVSQMYTHQYNPALRYTRQSNFVQLHALQIIACFRMPIFEYMSSRVMTVTKLTILIPSEEKKRHEKLQWDGNSVETFFKSVAN